MNVDDLAALNPGRPALVLGTEGAGMGTVTLAAVDLAVKIRFCEADRVVREDAHDPLLLVAGRNAVLLLQAVAIPFIPGSWQNPVVRTKVPL